MKKFAQVLAVVLVPSLAGVGWLERARLQSWYYVWRLTKADNSEKELWIKRVAELEQAAVPGLIRCLAQERESACVNSLSVLEKLIGAWGPEDPRTQGLLAQLSSRLGGFSWCGRHAALQLHASVFRETANPAPALLSLARKLALASMADDRTENRLAAIRLACHAGMDLFPELVPLLSDREAEVRAAALVALAGVQKADPAAADEFLVATDDMLPWLHDPDAGVRRLCETALRGRGLSAGQVELGRLITDEKAQVRLQVLSCLRRHRDLDWGVWLTRLSQDPTAAVRAAAVRAAAERNGLDAVDQLRQIAQNDPTPTVRQIAQHYLKFTPAQNPRGNPAR